MNPQEWKHLLARFLPWISLVAGAWSAFFVVRRYDQARRLAWILMAAWLLQGVLAWHRRRATGGRVGAVTNFALAWLSQSAAQELLFFTIPFWIRSTTWFSANGPFTVSVICLGITTTVDPVWQWIQASPRRRILHQSLVQFAVLAFLVPVLWGIDLPWGLAFSGGLSGAIALPALLPRRRWFAWPLGLVAGAALAVGGREWIAPVPLRLEGALFSRKVEGRVPADTLSQISPGSELWAWTPVFAPLDYREVLIHRWSRDGRKILEVPLRIQGGRQEGFRTWSNSLRSTTRPGKVEVEVLTTGGQLVGRISTEVR